MPDSFSIPRSAPSPRRPRHWFSARAVGLWLLIAILPALPTGCYSAVPVVPGGMPGIGGENPAFFAIGHAEQLWDPLVDVVDNYFQIAHEERVRQVGEIVTEGRIDTYPLTAATYLEPWRKDSVTRADRLEATLQSLRRRAVARVIPTGGGYLVEIQVHKELEDMIAPEHATAGVAAALHAGSLDRFEDRTESSLPGRLGWIPLGRDFALEQQMLADLRTRLALPPQPLAAPIFMPPP